MTQKEYELKCEIEKLRKENKELKIKNKDLEAQKKTLRSLFGSGKKQGKNLFKIAKQVLDGERIEFAEA